MRIVHIATELFPVAKIGGLADVLYGLSKELIHCGHEVEVILPKYDCLHSEELKQLKVECKQLASWDKAHTHHYTIWSAILDRIKLLLIETDHPSSYFSRGVIYGCPDDIDRFVYFSKAAIDYLFKSKKQPHVIHTHDWPTALIPLLYKEVYIPLGYPLGGSVFTIHNMEHQGKCEPV